MILWLFRDHNHINLLIKGTGHYLTGALYYDCFKWGWGFVAKNIITVNIDQVVKGLDEKKKNSELVLKRTVGDMRSRAPGWISKAVREEYNISAKDVKAALKTGNDGTISIGGTVVDNVTLTYSGRVLTPTHFKMKPTSRPSSNKGYNVTAEIKKGARKSLGSHVFLAGSGGSGSTQIPFKRKGQSRLPIEAVKTLSIPQMIQSGEGTKPRIEQAINEGLEKRFKHYCDQYLR
jgi:hypothetical protein